MLPDSGGVEATERQMSPHGTSGDNMNYTDDRWRNWLSQLKGPGVKGIVFDTWNGYTEGYAAAPTREHGDTVYLTWSSSEFTSSAKAGGISGVR